METIGKKYNNLSNNIKNYSGQTKKMLSTEEINQIFSDF